MKSKRKSFPHLFLTLFIVLTVIVILVVLVSGITANLLWFQEVNYLSVFFTQAFTKIGLGISTFLISGTFVGINFILARRQIDKQKIIISQNNKLRSQSPVLKLNFLLLIIIFFTVLISAILFYLTVVFINLSDIAIELPNLKPTSSYPLQLHFLPDLETLLSLPIWQVLLTIVFLSCILIFQTTLALNIIGIYYTIIIAVISSKYWFRFLHFFNSIPFQEQDAIFQKDLSFYIFKIPFLQVLSIWLESLFIMTIAIVTLEYLLAHNSISDGKFRGFERFQLRHLYALGSGLMLILAGIHWLNRYLLLFSTQGAVYGIAYVDKNINLPRENIACIVALLISIWLFFKFINGSGNKLYRSKNKLQFLTFSTFPLLLYVLFYGLGLLLTPLIQHTIVEPNELALERPYIENNIKATRAAFNLDNIEVKTFNPEGNLTAEDIAKNDLTINNIRLWDSLPILQANRQLQQIRPYYVFNDGDIDRYNIKTNIATGENKQVIIAARELDAQLLPSQAQTWVNQHLVYTHGYGFTMSPVNRVDEGGLPYYFIKDIGTVEDPGALNTSSPEIRESIPILRPRIYYGEVSKNYIMTNTKVREFDFPSGQDNVYHQYDGKGGITISSSWRKFLFSVYLRDWRILLTNNFTPDSRIFFRRDIHTRLKAIAPFLSYDRDPYLVVAKEEGQVLDNLYWLIDGYTISDYYPYSDGGESHFNYIRNSVKVLINAENGDVNFYISDTEDPIIQVWQKIFPNLFKPLNAMPLDIKQHIRYPIDLFTTQSERLLTYHMTDPQVFYNREDQWNVPQEIYGSEVSAINPYYLIMKLPIGEKEEFILLHPYTPISRPNLIAWLAARCDGDNYGKLLLYQFPKQRLIFGPDQIEALINQDPVISGQISLWNRQGSKVVQGHLLIIPIEESLLYVEPLYIEAEQNSVPTLARVIVVYENKIVMTHSLKNALDTIFVSPNNQEESAIIRSLDDNIIPNLDLETNPATTEQ